MVLAESAIFTKHCMFINRYTPNKVHFMAH